MSQLRAFIELYLKENGWVKQPRPAGEMTEWSKPGSEAWERLYFAEAVMAQCAFEEGRPA